MAIVAFLDSNVLASKTQRDWFFKISLHKPAIIRLVTSTKVLEEAMRAFHKRNPSVTHNTLETFRERMEGVFSDVVESPLGNDAIDGVHPGDWHVHSSVINSAASVLVSNNTRHFSRQYSYALATPDDMLCSLFHAHPDILIRVAQHEARYWGEQARLGRPAQSITDALKRSGCQRFSALVSGALQEGG